MSVGVQKQIKDNSTDVREYFTDLLRWTGEEDKREQRRLMRKAAETGAPMPPPTAKKPSSSSTEDTSKSGGTSEGRSEEAIKRDKNPMPQYYHDWDSYDAEAEEERVEEEIREEIQREREARQAEKDRILDDMAINGEGERKRTTTAKPRVKIAVRQSGRRASPVDLATPKKEEANRYLAEGRYREAMMIYTAGIDLLEKYEPSAFDAAAKKAKKDAEAEVLGPQSQAVDAEDLCGKDPEALALKTALLANRALAMLKLEEWYECIEDCTEALRFEPTHHKATLRRGFACAKMKRWGPAHRDLQKAVQTDPSDKKAQAELSMVKRMLEAQVKQSRTSAMASMSDPTRSNVMPTRKLTVKVKRSTGADVDGFVPSKPDVPASASSTSSGLAQDERKEGSAPLETAPRERQPYVPKSVRMRGRQAPPPGAAAATVSSSGSSAYPATSGMGTATGSRAGAPQAMNFYTFEAQWNSLGKSGGAAARIPLLRKIGAKAVPTLFRESLDAELLASIVQVLQAALEAEESDLGDLSGSSEDAGHFTVEVLDALVRTQRFDLSLGGLSRSERAACGRVLGRLEEQRCCDEETLERLRDAFAPPKTAFLDDLEDDVDVSRSQAPDSTAQAPDDDEFDPDDVPEPTFKKANCDAVDESMHSEYVSSSGVGSVGNGASYISLDDCD